jgi:hypothetical protein
MRAVKLGLLVFVAGATGCATITRGTTEAWTVQTEPTGAQVTLSTGETCTSPCTLKLKRKLPFTVTLLKQGYVKVTTDVLSQIAGAGAAGMAGNVLVGGIIGVGIDAASGATKELKPNPLIVSLEPETVATADDAVISDVPAAPSAESTD